MTTILLYALGAFLMLAYLLVTQRRRVGRLGWRYVAFALVIAALWLIALLGAGVDRLLRPKGGAL